MLFNFKLSARNKVVIKKTLKLLINFDKIILIKISQFFNRIRIVIIIAEPIYKEICEI